MDQSPKKHIIIELEEELAEEMFDSLESGELDTELGIELCAILRKGLGRPEYQPQPLSLSERIFFRILRIVVFGLCSWDGRDDCCGVSGIPSAWQ